MKRNVTFSAILWKYMEGERMPRSNKSKMPPLIRLARATYGRILRAGGKVRLVNSCGIDLTEGPYLLLSNHVGIMDPVMISAVMPRHIRWVAGAYLFKTRFLNLVIGKGCTAIPKQQGRSDISMIRNAQRAFRNGENVGLFPEGTRTWDGEMVDMPYRSLAKLLRLFKVTVIFVHLEGGFAHQPRWADFKRKGSVTVNVKHFLTPGQIEVLDSATLEETIREYLRFSNDEWKETVTYDYRSPRRAEGLQRLFYLCPSCGGIDTMKTMDNRIICTKCNAGTVLDEKDNLTSVDTPFTRLSQWHTWEAEMICDRDEFPPEPGVLFQKGDADDEGDLQTISKNITVRLAHDVLEIKCNTGKREVFRLELDKVNSLVLNAKQTMELFFGDVLYRIRLLPQACSLKYHEYYLGFRRKQMKENL